MLSWFEHEKSFITSGPEPRKNTWHTGNYLCKANALITSRNHAYTITTPLKSHFYIVKLDFTGVYIFLISAQNIDCGYSLEQFTVDSRYLEDQGTLWNISRSPDPNISDLQNWGKKWNEQPHFTNVIWFLKLEIYWTYCGKEETLLLRSNFSSFPQYVFACC